MMRFLKGLLLAVAFAGSAQAQLPPINGVAGPTSSAQTKSIITDPTGSGPMVFGTAPTVTSPSVGDGQIFVPASPGTLSTTLGSTLFSTATLTGGTGGIRALQMTAGLQPTIALGTLPGSGQLVSPWDLAVTVGGFNSDGTSDYRVFRSITTFNNSDASNAAKTYGRYNGFNFAGSGTGNVFVSYTAHNFTELTGATNVDNAIGFFHHSPLLGTGVSGTLTSFSAGPSVTPASESITASATGAVLTVTAAASDAVFPGFLITGTDGTHAMPAGVYVTSNGTGTGGTGTYNLSQTVSPAVTSTTMRSRPTSTLNSSLGFSTSDIAGDRVHSVTAHKASDTSVDLTGQAQTISSGTYADPVITLSPAATTINSGTYVNTSAGTITLTMGAAPPTGVSVGSNLVVVATAGTGAFASLSGTWPVTNIAGNVITLTGPPSVGAATITSGTAASSSVALPAVIGNYYTLASLTGTGGFATLNGSWIVSNVTSTSITLAGPPGAGASTITGGTGTPVHRIISGTYDTVNNKITVVTATPITIGGLQSITLSGLTGTGAFASLNGTFLSVIQDGTNKGHPNGTTLVISGPTPAVGASTITGGVLTHSAGSVVSFSSEQTGTTNFAFKSSGNAAWLNSGAMIQIGNVTWQGTQTSMTQNFTLSRSMGAVASVNTGITSQISFSASNTNADVRGHAISMLPSGSTNINNVIASPISITNSSTGTTATAVGIGTSITLNGTGSTTTSRGARTTFQLSNSGNITTATAFYADAPTLGQSGATGAITTAEGFTVNQIGHATLVTNVIGFRMTDTSAATSVVAFQGEVTAAAGKKNLNITGTADNLLTGATTFGSYIEGSEQNAPAAPAANGYRIFAQDNGAGKTQLMVIFSSGAAQQLAIQPRRRRKNEKVVSRRFARRGAGHRHTGFRPAATAYRSQRGERLQATAE